MRNKQVFPTDQIAHLWANQNQNSARNPQGNFSFSGRSLYSYSTVIAELYEENQNICFITTRRYSNTTSGQVWEARRGANFKTIVNVREPHDIFEYSPSFWENIDGWANDAISKLKSSQAPKIQAKTRIKLKEAAIEDLDNLVKFLEIFSLTIETLKNKKREYKRYKDSTPAHLPANFKNLVKLVSDRANILTDEQSFLDDYNKAKDKAHKEKLKREEKARKEREEKAKEYLSLWLKGELVHTSHLHSIPTIYLRATPQTNATQVQTSWGACVDIKRAKVLYNMLSNPKKNEKRILGFDIDGYKVVEVTGEHIKVGCHIITLSEVARFAKLMKW